MKKLMKSVSVLLALIIAVTAFVIPCAAGGTSIARAAEISFGKTYNDSITDSSTKDFYYFELPSSGKIALNFTGQISKVDLRIYDSDAKEIWKNNYVDANSASGMISYTESFDFTKGKYYFEVIKDTGIGNYSFSFDFVSANETFTETGTGVDNTIVEANNIVFDKTYNGQIALTDSKDFYKFELASSGKWSIQFNGKITSTDLYLFDSDGKEIWKNCYVDANKSTGEIAYSESIHLTKGVYYFGVVKDYTYTGPYNFGMSFVSADESFTESKNGINNSMDTASAISLNKEYKGQIALIDNKDFYKFTLSSASKVTVNLKGKLNAVDLYIYDSEGKEMWKEVYITASNSTGEVVCSKEVSLTAGTYYFGVIKDYTHTGNYTFTLSTNGTVITPPDTPSTVKTLSSVSVTTLPAKTEYVIGETFDSNGMVVKATYTDGTSAVVTNYTVGGFDSSSAGNVNVNISYTENGVTKTASFTVTVTEETSDEGGFSFDFITDIFSSIADFFAMIIDIILKLFTAFI